MMADRVTRPPWPPPAGGRDRRVGDAGRIDEEGPTTTTARSQDAAHRPAAPAPSRRRATIAGLLLGIGLGGFVDGIVLHQVLQWHHMLTAQDRHESFPEMTVRSLEENTVWDGLFHVVAWLFVLVGLWLLWRVTAAGHRMGSRSLVGLLLAGWGTFNLVEGLVDHHLLAVHHVRDDVAEPLWWDLGFLAVGALLVVIGAVLRRSDRGRTQS